MPFEVRASWSALAFSAPSPLILRLVVEAEARTDVLRDQVDLPGVHRRDPVLARAETELALDRVAGLLEDLGVDLGHQLAIRRSCPTRSGSVPCSHRRPRCRPRTRPASKRRTQHAGCPHCLLSSSVVADRRHSPAYLTSGSSFGQYLFRGQLAVPATDDERRASSARPSASRTPCGVIARWVRASAKSTPIASADTRIAPP